PRKGRVDLAHLPALGVAELGEHVLGARALGALLELGAPILRLDRFQLPRAAPGAADERRPALEQVAPEPLEGFAVVRHSRLLRGESGDARRPGPAASRAGNAQAPRRLLVGEGQPALPAPGVPARPVREMNDRTITVIGGGLA